jgi:dihydroorotate dehydrogenase electron transfer subunit
MNCLEDLDSSLIEGATVMVVGPGIMMKKVSEWAKAKGLSCFVSLEQRMACGIGACLVCVCKIKAEEEGKEFVHKRCCKDGPVFRAEEVIW